MRALDVSAMPMTRSSLKDGEQSCATLLRACSANAQACVTLELTPCRLAQSKALSFVQAKHQFVVQKLGPQSTFHMEVERIYQRAIIRQRGL